MIDFSLPMDVGPGDMSFSIKGFFNLVTAAKAGAAYSYLKNFVFSSTGTEELQQLTHANQDSDFVNWNVQDLSRTYPGEQDDRIGYLPYSRLVSWLDSRSIELQVDKTPFKFGKRSSEWRRVSDAGLQALKAKSAVFDARNAIRVFDVAPGGDALSIQPALYSQQAATNLIADFRIREYADTGQHRTLRQILTSETPLVLPRLDDARLANTLGISVLVLCHDDDGNLRPLLQVRDPKSAAMKNSGIHCTGSKAALWPREHQSMSIDNFFDDEAYESVERDFDLRKDDGLRLYPVALVREHARLGKPQLFYFGYTSKPLDEILKFRLEKQREGEIMTDESTRKYRSLTLDAFRKLITTDIWDDRESYKLTHEAYAMLYMMINEFGSRS